MKSSRVSLRSETRPFLLGFGIIRKGKNVPEKQVSILNPVKLNVKLTRLLFKSKKVSGNDRKSRSHMWLPAKKY